MYTVYTYKCMVLGNLTLFLLFVLDISHSSRAEESAQCCGINPAFSTIAHCTRFITLEPFY